MLLAVLGASRLGAASAVSAEKIYRLPPFIVEQQTGMRWRYAQIPGAEILARCEDARTIEVVQGFERALRLLGQVLPERLQPARDVPRAFILYDATLWTPAEQQAALAGLFSQRAGPLGPRPDPGDAGDFYQNMALSDADVETTFALVTGSPRLVDSTYLTPAYVGSLLENAAPPLPSWFRVGFLRLYQEMHFDDNSIKAGPTLAGIGPRAHPGDTGFLPLARLFDATTPAQSGLADAWVAGNAWFVRWGLDPTKDRKEAFLKFVERSGLGPPDEKLFLECFGFNFATGDNRLALYRGSARPLLWITAIPPLQVELRDAARGEVARLRGEWERLETDFVRTESPELASAYEEKARRTLLHSYERGDRDPRLLATLGLLELGADHGRLARGYLDEAVAAGVVRPRAWFEVARLRYGGERNRGLRDDGKLNPEQVALVLTPLLQALAQRPPQPKAYALAAEVLLHGVEAPDPKIASLLDDGVRFFPRDGELIWRVAQVHLLNGEKSRAAEMARAALSFVTGDSLRERLRSIAAADEAPAR